MVMSPLNRASGSCPPSATGERPRAGRDEGRGDRARRVDVVKHHRPLGSLHHGFASRRNEPGALPRRTLPHLRRLAAVRIACRRSMIVRRWCSTAERIPPECLSNLEVLPSTIRCAPDLDDDGMVERLRAFAVTRRVPRRF